MISRRSFLGTAFLGTAGIVAFPGVIVSVRRPLLWIADSEPCVGIAVQFPARYYGLADAHIYECKRTAIKCLNTEINKPALIVTDYLSGQMRGDEFIRLARLASPGTKLILFSAVVGNIEEYKALAGSNVTRPDAIVEKPNIRKLIAVL